MNKLTESLWGDEGFSALAVRKPFGEMMSVVLADTSPPLFYWVGWTWGRIFGFSEVSLRSLNLLLMLGGATFAGLIAYEIGKRWWLATMVGLLVFFSPFLNQFAFEWRMYALLFFTVMGSVYFFTKRSWGWYVGFTVAALYTHYFALFTLAGQGIWWLLTEVDFKQPKEWWGELWPFVAVVGLYLPWVYPMYLQTTRVQGSGFWLKVPKAGEVVDLLYRFATAGVRESKRWIAAGLGGVLLLGKQWKKVGKKWLMLLVVFMSPVVLAIVVSYGITPIFYDRYLLATAGGMLVLLALGARKWLGVVLAVWVGWLGYMSWQQFNQAEKKPFRELAAYVKEVKTEEDRLITIQGKEHHLWESKYYGIPAKLYAPGGDLPLFVGTAQMTDEDIIKELPDTEGRVGLITSDPIEEIDLKGMKLVDYKKFDGLVFAWWKKK